MAAKMKLGKPKKMDLPDGRVSNIVRKNVFISRFLELRDPTTAAIEAGYKQPSSAAKRLLADPYVAEMVNRAEEQAVARLGISAAYVLGKIKDVVDYAMQTVEGKETLLDGSGKVKKMVNPKVALGGLMMLGKYTGVFKEQVEVTGTLNIEALEAARQRVISMEKGEDWKVLEAEAKDEFIG